MNPPFNPHNNKFCLFRWFQEERSAGEPWSSRRHGEWVIDDFYTHSRVTRLNRQDGMFKTPVSAATAQHKPASDVSKVPAHSQSTLHRVPKDIQDEPAKSKPESMPSLQITSGSIKRGPGVRVIGSVTLVTNGARVKTSISRHKKLCSLPPPRQVRAFEYPDAHLLGLPYEVRDQIFSQVFGSALVIMSTVENFERNLLRRATACRSPYDVNGIPGSVFPCLAVAESNGSLRLLRAKQLFGQPLRWRNLPYSRGRKVVICEEIERPIGSEFLFSCKQLASEFAPQVCSRTVFTFGSSRAVRRFLNAQDRLARRYEQQWGHVVDKSALLFLRNKQNMTSFCLEIKRYGEPHQPAFRRYISKYYDSWRRTCRQLALELPSLTNIAISIVIPPPAHRYQCQLRLDAEWVSPLLEFAASRSLQSAAVTLLLEHHGAGSTQDTCIAFSEVVRRKMLGWDDTAALEALSDFRDQSHTCPSSWDIVGHANGLNLKSEPTSFYEKQKPFKRAA